ncbi:MAG: alpha/beta hydrolase [Tannerella sp.]|jgi:pimeloyl-ACP methyl ester carboxylesterase|nr:alpha/beta hydrolase [Tannerella sp.]
MSKTAKQTYYNSDVYKSVEGRHLLHELYRKLLMETDVPVAETMVETTFGDTHVTLFGNPEGKPVMTFYGENVIGTLLLRPFLHGLDLKRIRLVVPDPPGCIGFSTGQRISSSQNDYGKWICQVMDRLGIMQSPVFGYSFGAGIALQLCRTSILRIERLLLVAPSGIISPLSQRIARLLSPAHKEAAAITDDLIKTTLASFIPFPPDDLIAAAKLIYTHANITKPSGKTYGYNVLHKLNAPVYIVAEKSDGLFPGEKLLKLAKKRFPRVSKTFLFNAGSQLSLLGDAKAPPDYYAAMTDFLLET